MFAMYGSLCCCSSSTQLQAYALGEMSKGEHLGYSRQGCTTGTAVVSLKEDRSVLRVYAIISVSSFIFIGVCGSMASFVLLRVLLKALSQKVEAINYSFEYYGMFWGMSAILCPVLILLLYRDIAHISQITFNHQSTKYVRYIWPVVLAFPIIFCAPVAIYFGVKFNLPTPSLYLLPAKLLCYCSEKRAQVLVLSLTLWFNLVGANFIVGHCVFVLKAFPVAPFAVAVNVLLLVLTFLCLTYIMALVFTICASVGTRRCLRSRAGCVATVRAAMLIPLLLAIIGFGFKDALNSQFVNTATQQNSFYEFLKALFTPVLLAVVSLSLKKFISVWMHWSPGGEEGNNTVYPLHGHRHNGYLALEGVVVE